MRKSPEGMGSIDNKIKLGFMIGAITLALSSCQPNLEKIEGKLSDTESELLDRGDHQPEINKEGNIYISHLGEGDEKQIKIMEKGTRKRSNENEKKYNRLLEKRNNLLGKRDDAIAKGENYNPNGYNEDQFKNSNATIRESIKNRNAERTKNTEKNKNTKERKEYQHEEHSKQYECDESTRENLN